MNILKQFILISIILLPGFVQSQKPIVAKSVETQNVMSPELMWQLGRVSPIGLSKDGKSVIYRVSTPNMDENKFSSKVYSVSINGGTSSEISDYESSVNNKNIS
ncbi:MAG TPA: hypothetical protein PJ990_01210, partial [Saprospiraceae bacterium]|nr:hypothetical protein [Saprospiraceae bacterium]